ncbi:MAG: TIR domain-containing protein [Lachnospiraceae bacterium]|nr:TIR domain-containing protein [Lachnospiraceae bacterium]
MEQSVYELQQMALDKNVDIEELLRKAYLIAVLINQKDIEKWVLNEQNGYKCVENLPEYRFLRGELKAYNHGRWIPTQFTKQEQAEAFSKLPFMESISEIIEAYQNSNNGIASYSITDTLTQALNRNGSFVTVYNYFVSTGQLKQVINSVQNKILHWTIELEKSGYMVEKEFPEKPVGKEEDGLKKLNIFLSYCWNDSNEANNIYAYLKNNQNIELHRDTIDIQKWGSIKEYMQSISNMDYTILLISDSYLKSANCMYEVLEVMRDRNYEDKIFPAVIDSEIYSPITRAKYVKHWQNEFSELESVLKDISVQNLGKLNEDLKRRQDISSNIAEFLDVISDMNNPNIEDVCVAIEEKLSQKGFLGNKSSQITDDNDLFATLGIPKIKYNSEPTDLEINQFVKDSFSQVVKLLSQLCQQYQTQNTWMQVQIEQIDTRTVIYQFYKNGQLARKLRIFLSSMMGSRQESIGVSDNVMPHGNGDSWNGMYDAQFVEGELKLFATLSLFGNHKAMTVEEVVADIWEHYIHMYLER